MTPTFASTMRKALQHLEAERQQIERQISVIRSLLGRSGGGRRDATSKGRPRRRQSHPRMSPAARKAVSQRMKAYWAKRRAEKAKAKGKP